MPATTVETFSPSNIADIDMFKLEIFCNVVALNSMSAAGRAMGLSPAVISKHIAHLENYLGVMLLTRSTRRQVLTEAGKKFYKSACEILDAIRQACAELSCIEPEPITVPATDKDWHTPDEIPEPGFVEAEFPASWNARCRLAGNPLETGAACCIAVAGGKRQWLRAVHFEGSAPAMEPWQPVRWRHFAAARPIQEVRKVRKPRLTLQAAEGAAAQAA